MLDDDDVFPEVTVHCIGRSYIRPYGYNDVPGN